MVPSHYNRRLHVSLSLGESCISGGRIPTLLLRFRHGTQALDMQRRFLEPSSGATSFLPLRRALGGASAGGALWLSIPVEMSISRRRGRRRGLVLRRGVAAQRMTARCCEASGGASVRWAEMSQARDGPQHAASGRGRRRRRSRRAAHRAELLRVRTLMAAPSDWIHPSALSGRQREYILSAAHGR